MIDLQLKELFAPGLAAWLTALVPENEPVSRTDLAYQSAVLDTDEVLTELTEAETRLVLRSVRANERISAHLKRLVDAAPDKDAELTADVAVNAIAQRDLLDGFTRRVNCMTQSAMWASVEYRLLADGVAPEKVAHLTLCKDGVVVFRKEPDARDALGSALGMLIISGLGGIRL